MTELGQGHEFDLIRRMRARWGTLAADIGGDAAVLQPPAGEQLVLSVDAALEGVHFRRDWLTLREAAYRAVTAALSDLAATGATPRGVLVALAIRDTDDVVDDLADGIGDAVRAAGTVVLGGNLARGDSLAITTTVVGSAVTPLSRSGARSGDMLYVTGRLGAPRAAIRALHAHAPLAADLRARFARPEARIAAARWLAEQGATAAIDVSDGLAGDAGHLAAASAVTVEIQTERIPVFPGATAEDALAGGEEYELLFTAPARLPESEFATRFGIALTPIGRILEGAGEVHLTRAGRRVAAPAGYDHFSR